MHRLLLVDDSPTMHRIVELSFARENVQVIAVRDGEQAMRALASSRPDIVLADHAAAGRDGYELASYVREQPDLADVPVLLMGGAFEPVDEARAAESGSDGVVVKPVEPIKLVERVRALIDGRARAHHPRAGQPPASFEPEPPAAAPQPAVTAADVAPSESPSAVFYSETVPGAFASPAADGGLEPESSDPPTHQEPRLDAPPALSNSADAPVASQQPIMPAAVVTGPAPTPRQATRDGLDDYFERLDAALGTLGASRDGQVDDRPLTAETLSRLMEVLSPESVHPHEPQDVPTVQALLTEAPSDPPSDTAADGIAHASLPDRPSDEAHVEKTLASADDAAQGVDERLVERIASRVVARLSPETVERLVREVVVEVAERLVRDELSREDVDRR